MVIVYKKWKKYNEIQSIKNKMDLNNRKMTNDKWQIKQVTSVRQWDWSNTAQNAYGTVSLHGAIVKIRENRAIVNIYLQELCYILLFMNLWGITVTVKCMVYVGSSYLYEGPTSVTETVRLIVLLLYYMLLWRLKFY